MRLDEMGWIGNSEWSASERERKNKNDPYGNYCQ